MKAILIATILLISNFCFGQKKSFDYGIYSEYFRVFQSEHGGKCNFIVRVQPKYGPTGDEPDIWSVLDELRDYSKNGRVTGSFFLYCQKLADTLKRDTLWLPLIDKLNKSIKRPHTIRNNFEKDIQVSMFTYSQYAECFENRSIEDGWGNFHEDYPGNSILTNISEIVNDDKRAVFYFSRRCGGLCGDGSLVLFYKDFTGWRYLCSIILWQS